MRFLVCNEAAALLPAPNKTIYLGMQDDIPILASPSGFDFAALPEFVKAIDYRSVYTQGLIPPDQLGAMAQAVSLLTWHDNHKFCGRCGSETVMRDGGYRRTCPNCEAQHFPRTDPVAIMMVVRGDKCLLARGRAFRPGHVFLPRRLYRTGRNDRERRAPRDASKRPTFRSAACSTTPASRGPSPIR